MKNILLFFNILLTFNACVGSGITCRTHATILRQIEREGFHVDMHSFIELIVDVETAWMWENCSIVLRENITPSFYVSSDQLLELSQAGISKACTSDKINIEAPQQVSPSHTTFVYGKLQRSQNMVFAHLNFPLHLRYHEPKSNGGYLVADIKSPILLVACANIDCVNLQKSKAPCSLCGNRQCTWMRFPFKTNNNNMSLPVPVGNLNHLWLVKPVTYGLTIASCVYVVLAVWITLK